MQRLLNDAVWDTTTAMGVIRRFVVEHLAPPVGELAVAALDETGQEKKGNATAGVKRQYMGCTGQVANGVNTVHCSYATRSGHALIGARLYLPPEQLEDPDRRAALGIPTDLAFRTKPQLGIDIITDAIADHTMPPWCAGDEVYGRSGQLRQHLQDHQIGYVLRVGCAFTVQLNPATRLRADAIAATHLSDQQHWQTVTVAGSKGERSYGWAWVGTTNPRHFLLIRRHHQSGELAYHYCYIPPGRPVTLAILVAVACLRWPVEEDFEFGKDHFGLDHSQARRYTALLRHTVLAMAALAVCAITAADAATAPSHPRPCPPGPTSHHPPIPG